MNTKKYEVTAFGTMRAFMKVGTCSGAAMSVLDRRFEDPMPAEERAVMPLAGGVAQQGHQCGLLWGATLSAGAESFRRYGAGEKAERAAMAAAHRLTKTLRGCTGHIDCLEITETDWTNKLSMLKNLLRGGPVACMRLSGKFTKAAVAEIEDSLDETETGTPACASCSVSCASRFVRRLGLPAKHAVMAAGLAGGIGMSGGGCGVLGAAIWVNEMLNGKEGDAYDKVNARAGELIDTFLKCSDYEMTCSQIVGQKFESIDEHAEYVQSGGCADIIEALARAVEADGVTQSKQSA